MNIPEQIQEGQYRANEIMRKIKMDMIVLDKYGISLSTYREELEAQLKRLFDFYKINNP